MGCVTLSSTSLYGQHTLSLSLEKDAYLVDELIWFEAIEWNKTGDTLNTSIFSTTMPMFCRINLTDESGNVYPFRGSTVRPVWPPPGAKLASGANRYLVGELHTFFGASDKSHCLNHSLLPGRYSLQVTLHTNHLYAVEDHPDTSKRTLYSNTAHFDIVEPWGEEKETHQAIMRAAALECKSRWARAGALYQGILEDYPASVYAMNAHEALRWNRPPVHDLQHLVSLYRDRYYAHALIGGIREDLLRDIFSVIEQSHLGSKAYEYLVAEIKHRRILME
jgi:hypothetical protein